MMQLRWAFRFFAVVLIASFVLVLPLASSQDKNDPAVTLPEGEGKAILLRACTTCHDLEGLKLFKGYYTEQNWRELIVDMVRVGAKVKDEEITILAKYLAEHFGPEKK
jgi:mono/diheme cytochrome c family protein